MSFVTVGVAVGTAALAAKKARQARQDQQGDEVLSTAVEGQRQQKIDSTRGEIDRAFASPQRQQQYDQFLSNLRDYLGGQLVQKKRDSARNLKFALAKAGQTGGSVANDATLRLGQEYAQGAAENERTSQSELAQLKAGDESEHQRLLELAQNGLSATDGYRRSNESIANNFTTANIKGAGEGLGDVFKDTGATYRAINERAAIRRGFGAGVSRSSIYGPQG